MTPPPTMHKTQDALVMVNRARRRLGKDPNFRLRARGAIWREVCYCTSLDIEPVSTFVGDTCYDSGVLRFSEALLY